jgi:hypothetical protein
MNIPVQIVLRRLGTGIAAASIFASAQANDFPTDSRVEYVLNCMRKHSPEAEQEMRYKCSCAIDQIAQQVSYDEYVELLTATLAMTIGGERGAAVRTAPETGDMAKRFHAIEAKANGSCFIR